MTRIHRREFLKIVPAMAYAAGAFDPNRVFAAEGASSDRRVIEPFDYVGVRLLESRWLDQFKAAREVYFRIPDDDILKGWRGEAGLPAPGQTLGGWCRKNSNTVFGQWLSGMARMYRATGDSEIKSKAIDLITEFAKTVKPDGDCGMRHYAFDKLVCGLVDMKLYADHDEAISLLDKVTDFAIKNLGRENIAAVPEKIYQGRPGEWYTLSENLFRAYQLTGNRKYEEFARAWLYPAFWDKFSDTSSPTDAWGVHAYSHVNTFSSAAMAYAVLGDPRYLRILKNAFEYLQHTQCYATGGFGPREQFVLPGKGLLKALQLRYDSFETVCGSWAGFKLSRYLTMFTGESKYGDWMERLFYNGIGAALQFAPGGRNFYYADYRLAGGIKAYNWDTFTCCSGTYIQDVADFHNLLYYRDSESLYVNLYVPSEVIWKRPEGDVTVSQQTSYPLDEASVFTLKMEKSIRFPMKFRIPGWASGVTLQVNGSTTGAQCVPGQWAEIAREWKSGDRIELRIPQRFRMESLDSENHDVVAVVRGPVVMVLESDYLEPAFTLPATNEELNKWLVPDKPPGSYRVEVPEGGRVRSKFLPFPDVIEGYPYLMYFDRKALPVSLR